MNELNCLLQSRYYCENFALNYNLKTPKIEHCVLLPMLAEGFAKKFKHKNNMLNIYLYTSHVMNNHNKL